MSFIELAGTELATEKEAGADVARRKIAVLKCRFLNPHPIQIAAVEPRFREPGIRHHRTGEERLMDIYALGGDVTKDSVREI
jgi:hypothetical protein